MPIALKYFPEILFVYVGICNDKGALGKKEACADTLNFIINFVPEIKPTFVTIFHELMHLVAGNNSQMPKTEEFCSISAMARMPKELVDDDVIPYITYYNSKLGGELAEYCRNAIKYRDNGGRDYIAHLRNELKKVEKEKENAM